MSKKKDELCVLCGKKLTPEEIINKHKHKSYISKLCGKCKQKYLAQGKNNKRNIESSYSSRYKHPQKYNGGYREYKRGRYYNTGKNMNPMSEKLMHRLVELEAQQKSAQYINNEKERERIHKDIKIQLDRVYEQYEGMGSGDRPVTKKSKNKVPNINDPNDKSFMGKAGSMIPTVIGYGSVMYNLANSAPGKAVTKYISDKYFKSKKVPDPNIVPPPLISAKTMESTTSDEYKTDYPDSISSKKPTDSSSEYTNSSPSIIQPVLDVIESSKKYLSNFGSDQEIIQTSMGPKAVNKNKNIPLSNIRTDEKYDKNLDSSIKISSSHNDESTNDITKRSSKK
jgi:hypothetical protein